MFTSIMSLGLTTLLLLPQTQAIAFPAPTGPYGTALSIANLIDKSRLDPFAPTKQPRNLMVSVFYPVNQRACTNTTVPYMDATTAAFEDAKFSVYGLPAGTFGSLELQVCSVSKSRIQKSQDFPVIMFSPALATTRLVYSAIAQQVASFGYAVVTVDHPYDVDIITYPDNTTVQGIDIPDDKIPFLVDTRVKDISFVVNQLGRPSVVKNLFGGSCSPLDLSKVGIFGHSVGGAATAEALLYDPRLRGGINLDGTLFGRVLTTGLRSPFILFGHEGKNTTTDPSWATMWPKLTGWKRELMMAGSQHYAFSDLINIVDVLGLTDSLPAEVGELLGTIKGQRAFTVVTAYVTQFFDMLLKGKNTTLFAGPVAQFPEITFANP